MEKYEIPITIVGYSWVFCFFWLFFIAPSFGRINTQISAIIFICLSVLAYIFVSYAYKKEKKLKD